MRLKPIMTDGKWLSVLAVVLVLVPNTSVSKVVESSETGFTLELELELPVSPEVAYDVMTGDISKWWDHSFSDSPKALYIDPKPGGGFYEIFDDSGDGVLHATVNAAHRGKLLRFTGPLGLAGSAVVFVTTYTYEARGDGSLVEVKIDASGNIEPNWADVVDGVWKHFLFERLEPYIKSGRYLEDGLEESKY
ncbi:MAG: hypothetical protein JSW50_15785 [Candidatus Latescibacterota bacterium]|nr:MAG: hypothetical protein JSW50_15785 [Candidatus Latescibacterota bacterium]